MRLNDVFDCMSSPIPLINDTGAGRRGIRLSDGSEMETLE